MQRVTLRELSATSEKYADSLITVAGWVRTLRTSKHLGFIELNDGTAFKNLQVVFEDNKVNNFDEIGKLNVGAAVIVKGKLLLTPEAKQPYEIHAEEIEIEGTSTPDYPLQKKKTLCGIPAYHCSSASKNQYFQCCVPRTFRSSLRYS